MLKDLLIFPFGGNAREALLSIFAINALKKEWRILGFIDDDKSNWGKDCCGIKVLGGKEMLKKFPGAKILAVPGSPDNFLKRKEIINSLKLEAGRFAAIIDPSAVLAPDAKIGSNTLLMSNVFISCGAAIGDNCVILPNTVVSHESVIGDYCCVGSNVSISGNVVIAPMCYIGSGVSVKERVSIGRRTLIGLGATVISDIEEGVVAVGCPAHVIRKV